MHHTDIVSREEVLKKVWDDNGLTSSNSNLNQYLSMLRKTFRHYGIDNIIITVARGYLQLNPDVSIEPLDEAPAPPAIIEPFLIPDVDAPTSSEDTESAPSTLTPVTHSHDAYWYFAGLMFVNHFDFVGSLQFVRYQRGAPHRFDATFS